MKISGVAGARKRPVRDEQAAGIVVAVAGGERGAGGAVDPGLGRKQRTGVWPQAALSMPVLSVIAARPEPGLGWLTFEVTLP